ncbi:MAG: DUF349 domain-containing protein [Gammaproteobacteria bacterium]|nr:DUF349 domain-containing protein [Gammaproteobacteria bacterium]
MSSQGFLSRFFKGKDPLASSVAEERLTAVAALTDEQAATEQKRLAELAANDPDALVRRAAINHLEDEAALSALLDDSAVAAAAAQRLGSKDSRLDHPAVRQARMQAASTPEAALHIAGEAKRAKELAELYLCCPDALRPTLMAVLRKSGEAGLSALEKRSRSRDKASNRCARAELDRMRNVVKSVGDMRTRAEELATVLNKSEDEDLTPRIIHLKKELQGCCQSIQSKLSALAEYGSEAPDLSAWLAAATYDETPRAAPAPKLKAANASFQTLGQAFKELAEQMAAGVAFDAVKERREALTAEWMTLADQAQPDDAQHRLFESVSHQYQELAEAVERCRGLATPTEDAPPQITEWPREPEALRALWTRQRAAGQQRKALERALARLRWPDWAKPPPPLRQATARIADLRHFEDVARAHQEQIAEQLEAAVQEIGTAIESGRLQGAVSALGLARRLGKSLPDRLAAAHRKAISQRAAQVDELRDWQTFATAPKRERLVQAMNALAEHPEPPREQAARIKALRSEWGTLGNPSSSRERGLHGQFNRAAERAFEPCRAYYAEQAELRSRNLAGRERICAQLETYLANVDWSSADMKAAEQIMRTAREEWRSLHPVDRKKSKAIEARFERSQERIHAEVKKAWEGNLASKREIVAAAEALAMGDADMAAMVAEVKRLQQRWRAVGVTPRSADQKLWRQFRGHCDRVFSARDAHRQQAEQQVDEAVASAEDLCRALQAALEASATQPPDPALVHRLRAELDELELPERHRRPALRRFEDLARDYSKVLRIAKHKAELAHIEQLEAWDLEISQAEAEGRPVEAPAPEFRGRGQDSSDSEQTLRELTVAAEIQASIESPPEDAELRLQVQVKTLNESINRGTGRKAPPELAAEWCRTGPKTPASDPLRKRFFAALRVLSEAA